MLPHCSEFALILNLILKFCLKACFSLLAILLESDEGLCGRVDDRGPGQQAGDRHPRLPQVPVLLCLDAPAVLFTHS